MRERDIITVKTLKLPRLISDGMILQQKKRVRIWGEDEPEREVSVSFLGKKYVANADKDGYWEIFLEGLEPGGAYEMHISDDAGNEKSINDILIGDVWMCSGQSNMELPMNRVRDKYPEEIRNCTNSCIRTFKITEHSDFHAPLKELLTGEWKAAGNDTILDFSATAYFFAEQIYKMTGIPVGLINASLGGSRIESWMSREMLEGYDDFLSLADRYSDDDFIEERVRINQRQAEEWHGRLESMDLGVKEGWERCGIDTSDFKEIKIPCFFKDTELKGFIGSVWFRREFTVSGEFAKREAKLWLGTIVDSDTVYINGVLVGHTDYQYPPRKYIVPAGVLKEGSNIITIRVKSEAGHGRFTDGKIYAIFNDEEKVELSGTWKYRIGASCDMVPETDFVNWKPTGLYNGMMAPCHKYTIAGVLWYQGEANTDRPERYLDLMRRMINGYRKNWEDTKLPFFYVQLPNFSTEIYDMDRHGTFHDWPAMREAQRQALEIPDTGMVVAIDLGEDNDLHPLNKKGVGYRLAMLAADRLYEHKSGCDGPQIEKVVIERVDTERIDLERKDVEKIDVEESTAKIPDTRVIATLFLKNVTDGIHAFSENKGNEITDFELVDEKGIRHRAKAEIHENRVLLSCEEDISDVCEIKYCGYNTNSGALIYNKEGFPMSPFSISVKN